MEAKTKNQLKAELWVQENFSSRIYTKNERDLFAGIYLAGLLEGQGYGY
jgi:hypothetical protein